MSPEIIEAVFAYSDSHQKPLMLIASKNQIDWDGGYVENWTTSQYRKFVDQLKAKYSNSRVYLCRDHLGPGFKNDDLEDVHRTVDDDIKNGFDLIHVDFCHLKGGYEEILEQSKKAIKYILGQKPTVLLEIGTDENAGEFRENLERVEEQMKFFTTLAPIQFFVTQTGSLVKEIGQAGNFNQAYIQKVRQIADRFGLNLKEHNCDYVESEAIKNRQGLINAVNVAPQFGVIQTLLSLQKAVVYGIDSSDFLNEAYQSGKWKKWLHHHTADNEHLCSIISGHYVFAGQAYKKLVEKINRYENFKEIVMQEMTKIFDLYLNHL